MPVISQTQKAISIQVTDLDNHDKQVEALRRMFKCRIQWHVLVLLHLEMTEGAMAAATAWQGQGTKSFIPEKWWPLAPDQAEN